jgi:hypothetical protein
MYLVHHFCCGGSTPEHGAEGGRLGGVVNDGSSVYTPTKQTVVHMRWRFLQLFLQIAGMRADGPC